MQRERRLARRATSPQDVEALRKALIPEVTPTRIAVFLFWIFGLWLMSYAPAPHTPSPEEQFKYESLQAKADTMIHAIESERHMWVAYQEMNAAKGWFWSCDEVCVHKTKVFEEKKAIFLKHNKERELVRQEAKATVGIWSDVGIQATRDSFWKAYERGKQFAKSMTWWDALFAIGSSRREENMVAVIVQWVLRIAMNFTIGFVYSLFSFAWGLIWIVADFSPNPASGAAFYAFGLLAGVSMVASVLIAMYGTIVTVFVGGAYVAVQNQSLEGGQGQRPRLHDVKNQ